MLRKQSARRRAAVAAAKAAPPRDAAVATVTPEPLVSSTRSPVVIPEPLASSTRSPVVLAEPLASSTRSPVVIPRHLGWHRQRAGSLVIGTYLFSGHGLKLLCAMLLLGIAGTALIADGGLQIIFGVVMLCALFAVGKVALPALFGKLELTVTGENVTLFEGLGSAAEIDHFSLRALREVRVECKQKKETLVTHLVLRIKEKSAYTSRENQVGATLSAERRMFMLSQLQSLIKDTQSKVQAEKAAKAAARQERGEAALKDSAES